MSFTWDGNLNLGFGAPPKSTSPSSVVVSSTTRPNVKSGSNRRAQSKRHTTKQKTHSEIFVEDFDFEPTVVPVEDPDFTISLAHSSDKSEESTQEEASSSQTEAPSSQELNPFGSQPSTFSFSGMANVLADLSTDFKFDATQAQNPFAISSEEKSEGATLGCTVENNIHSWKVHSQVLKRYIPSFFNSTAQLMGVNNSLTIPSDQLEYHVSPKNVKQLIDFMYNHQVTLDNERDLTSLITLCEFLVFQRFRDLLVKQLEYTITSADALFYLSWASQHTGACWRILSEKCITILSDSIVSVLPELIFGETATDPLKEIQFDYMYSLLRSINQKNMHYLRWKLLSLYLNERYDVDISTDIKFELIRVFLLAKDKLLLLQMTDFPPTQVFTTDKKSVADRRRKKDDMPEEADADKFDHLIADHRKIANKQSNDDVQLLDKKDEVESKKEIFEAITTDSRLIDVLCTGTPIMWDFLVNDVIASEIAHKFTEQQHKLILQAPEVIFRVLANNTLQVPNEDIVIDFLVQWYVDHNVSEATRQSKTYADALKLFSCARLYLISLPCIHKICHTAGLPDLLNNLTANLLRCAIDFKVSSVEHKMNTQKSVKFATPRQQSEWTEMKPRRKMRKANVRVIETPSSFDDSQGSADSQSDSEEEVTNSKNNKTNSTSNSILGEHNKKEVTQLFLSMLMKTTMTTQEIQDLMNQ